MTNQELIEMAEKVYGKCDWHGDALAHLEQFAKLVVEKTLETKDEPVATVISESGADVTHSWWHEPALPIGTKLYTSGWRKKQIQKIIEAKLKEKNT
jgi:hypothetical protein